MSFDHLLAGAEHKVDGANANTWLWEFRTQVEQEYGQCFLYEQVIENESWSNFLIEGLHKLLLHLEAKKLSPPVGPYLLVILWKGPNMHVYGAARFFEILCEIEKVELATLMSRAQQSTPVMALPPPKKED